MLKTFVRSINTTLKTKDEALLGRLKGLNLTGGKVLDKVATPPPDEGLPRNVTITKLLDIVKKHTSEPLLWNSSVLGRIYKVPEETCDKLVYYVRPLVFKVTREMDEPEKLLKTPYVIDVGRLVNDQNYTRFSKHKIAAR